MILHALYLRFSRFRNRCPSSHNVYILVLRAALLLTSATELFRMRTVSAFIAKSCLQIPNLFPSSHLCANVWFQTLEMWHMIFQRSVHHRDYVSETDWRCNYFIYKQVQLWSLPMVNEISRCNRVCYIESVEIFLRIKILQKNLFHVCLNHSNTARSLIDGAPIGARPVTYHEWQTRTHFPFV